MRRILEVFRIDGTLASLGVRSVHDLDPSHLELPAGWARVPRDMAEPSAAAA